MTTPEIAEIVGLLCAEGCYYSYIGRYWEFDKRRGKRYFRIRKNEVLQMANNNKDIQNRFLLLLDKVYSYKLKFYGPSNSMRCTIKRRDVIQDLRKYSRKYNPFDWKLSKSIESGNHDVRTAFLRGFFDGDGSFTKGSKSACRVRFISVNIKELRKVMRILESLDFNPKIYGPYMGGRSKTGYFELTLNTKDAMRFVEIVKPTKVKHI